MTWTAPSTATVGQVLTAAFWNAQVRDNFLYAKGSVTTWAAQIDQGVTTNIAKTVNEARYIQHGDMVSVWTYLVITGTGTASQTLALNLPVPAVGHNAGSAIGTAFYYDSSGTSATSHFVTVASLNGATQCTFFTDQLGGSIGTSPNIAVANNDQLRATLHYMAA